jgi:hypothetical protein
MCEGTELVEAGGRIPYAVSDAVNLPACRLLRGQNPERRQTRRSADRAAEKFELVSIWNSQADRSHDFTEHTGAGRRVIK